MSDLIAEQIEYALTAKTQDFRAGYYDGVAFWSSELKKLEVLKNAQRIEGLEAVVEQYELCKLGCPNCVQGGQG